MVPVLQYRLKSLKSLKFDCEAGAGGWSWTEYGHMPYGHIEYNRSREPYLLPRIQPFVLIPVIYILCVPGMYPGSNLAINMSILGSPTYRYSTIQPCSSALRHCSNCPLIFGVGCDSTLQLRSFYVKKSTFSKI